MLELITVLSIEVDFAKVVVRYNFMCNFSVMMLDKLSFLSDIFVFAVPTFSHRRHIELVSVLLAGWMSKSISAYLLFTFLFDFNETFNG